LVVGTVIIKPQFYTANFRGTQLYLNSAISSYPLVNNANNGGHVVDRSTSSGSGAITYSKGAFIIKTMRCYLGDEVFFGGLNNYLDDFHSGNPTTDDLFAAWDDYIDKSLKCSKHFAVLAKKGNFAKNRIYPRTPRRSI